VQRAYEVTLALVNKRKWLIIDEARAATAAPHRPDRGGGAHADHGLSRTSRSASSPDGDGSRVDIRSSSRYFESDLGSNASRVTKLIDGHQQRRRQGPAPKNRLRR